VLLVFFFLFVCLFVSLSDGCFYVSSSADIYLLVLLGERGREREREGEREREREREREGEREREKEREKEREAVHKSENNDLPSGTLTHASFVFRSNLRGCCKLFGSSGS